MAHLADEFFVDDDIAFGPVEGLLEEGEEDGDDDCGLEGLAEDDEEDGDGEDVDGHCFEGRGCAGLGVHGRGRGGREGRVLDVFEYLRQAGDGPRQCDMSV